jgi:hypothetical protein
MEPSLQVQIHERFEGSVMSEELIPHVFEFNHDRSDDLVLPEQRNV